MELIINNYKYFFIKELNLIKKNLGVFLYLILGFKFRGT